jgi:putative ABC transport system permease protein
MVSSYVKITFRNLLKNRFSALLNIGGLAVGMAVTMLIGLWIYDEVTFNKVHKNYDRIAMVMQNAVNNGQTGTVNVVPYPLAKELRENYGSDFKNVVLSKKETHILNYADKQLSRSGAVFEPAGPEMLSLKMLKGSAGSLKDASSVLLAASTAKAIFGEANPIDKVIKIDDKIPAKVTGVYDDLPRNSSFSDVLYIMPWQMFFNNTGWIRTINDPWRPNAFTIYAQLADNADLDKVSAKIKDAKLKNVNKELAKKKPQLFLQPMSKWNLYSEFKDGVNVGGRIKYVWLFGTIGLFVLLLACINFMNLSTARSEKRAKEVGIRKSIGSLRSQLISQFFMESVVVAFLSFLISLLLVQLSLGFFNQVANKNMTIPWSNPLFWLLGTGFSIITGIIAGSYPALYLSSFNPVKILKGTFKAGRWAAIPRRALVVFQFTVSVVLIIGTLIVFRQIQYAKNRPIGYDSNGLIALPMFTSEIHNHFNAVKNELLKTGAIVNMAEAGASTTEIYSTTSGVSWKGKDPNQPVDFPTLGVSYDYGKTIGWQFKEGRDFSKDFAADSMSIILNEAAIQFMGLKNPVGQTIQWFDETYTVIGVVKNIIMQSPYEPVRPTIFFLGLGRSNYTIIKINPSSNAGKALSQIETVYKKFNPSQPFEYRFIDEEYATKFDNEQRIGKLAGCFAVLAIFISCLGLFGMASFMSEQRTKEIGVRKVLGASVFNVWQLLTKDFVLLVAISFCIATPLAYYFMQSWLQDYHYRAEISWWTFALAGLGSLIITVITVSFQSIKAAIANPVSSLRSE